MRTAGLTAGEAGRHARQRSALVHSAERCGQAPRRCIVGAHPHGLVSLWRECSAVLVSSGAALLPHATFTPGAASSAHIRLATRLGWVAESK